MTLRTRLLRLFGGLIILVAALAGGFAVFMAQMPQWGATAAEVAQPLPGDDLLAAPMVNWTNARTITARPDQVWPWLAQIGDNARRVLQLHLYRGSRWRTDRRRRLHGELHQRQHHPPRMAEPCPG